MDTADTKTCTKCGETKPLSEFYKDRGRRRAECKVCSKRKLYALRDDRESWNAKRRAYYKAKPEAQPEKGRAFRDTNKERINADIRARRAADPEPFRVVQRRSWAKRAEQINKERRDRWPMIRDEVNASLRADRKANPEKHAAYERTRRERHGDKLKQRMREYYAANPDRFAMHRRKREARLAEVEYQPYTRTEIFERDGGRCRDCRCILENKPHGFQIDHIVPITLDGPDIPANVQLMCAPCNRRKWAKLEGQIHLPV